MAAYDKIGFVGEIVIERTLGGSQFGRDVVERRAVDAAPVEKPRRSSQQLLDLRGRGRTPVESIRGRRKKALDRDGRHEHVVRLFRIAVHDQVDEGLCGTGAERLVRALDPIDGQGNPRDGADEGLGDDFVVAGPHTAVFDASADERSDFRDIRLMGPHNRLARAAFEIIELAQHRAGHTTRIEGGPDIGEHPCESIAGNSPGSIEVRHRDLAAAAVALSRQIVAILHIIVDGRAGETHGFGDAPDRGARDAARIKLLRRRIE